MAVRLLRVRDQAMVVRGKMLVARERLLRVQRLVARERLLRVQVLVTRGSTIRGRLQARANSIGARVIWTTTVVCMCKVGIFAVEFSTSAQRCKS